MVQQRSPTLKVNTLLRSRIWHKLTLQTRKDEHVALLNSFASTNNFGFVLMLTSLDAANQDDAQLLYVVQPYSHLSYLLISVQNSPSTDYPSHHFSILRAHHSRSPAVPPILVAVTGLGSHAHLWFTSSHHCTLSSLPAVSWLDSTPPSIPPKQFGSSRVPDGLVCRR